MLNLIWLNIIKINFSYSANVFNSLKLKNGRFFEKLPKVIFVVVHSQDLENVFKALIFSVTAMLGTKNPLST